MWKIISVLGVSDDCASRHLANQAAKQARRQEMKWRSGCFVKKVTFPQRRVHYYVQYQYFFYFTFLFILGVRTHQRTPPRRA